MSTFSVALVTLDEVIPHPNADLLELAVIGGYRAVVGKGLHKTGDLVLYIPEEACLPQELCHEFGYGGKLAGSGKNRVKAIRLRGELSQGLVVPKATVDFALLKRGFEFLDVYPEDLAEALGIIKYEQPIPANMAGKARRRPEWFPMYTDIENIKKYPKIFRDDDLVIMTEKIHGTNFGVGMARGTREMLVSSRRMVLERDENNLYWRAAIQYNLEQVLNYILDETDEASSVIIWGEIYGSGIQNLGYGGEAGKLQYRVFDIQIDGDFVRLADMREWLECASVALKLPILDDAPILYAGPFSQEKLIEHTNGTTTLGGAKHTREGVVVRGQYERYERGLGRVILKSIADEYLLDKNRTDLQ